MCHYFNGFGGCFRGFGMVHGFGVVFGIILTVLAVLVIVKLVKDIFGLGSKNKREIQ